MMNWKYLTVLIIFIIIIGAYIFLTSQNQYERIEIAGSTSVQPVAEKLAQKYMEINPDVRINVQGGGSSLGIRSASQGIVDIGLSSRNLEQDEKENLKEYLIGSEGIVIAVNLKNPIDNISQEQLKDIFSGKITNWKELGGPDAEINVISREEGSGTRSAFEEIVMGDTKITNQAIIQTSTESVKQTVKQDTYAVGFVSLSHMSDDVKALKVDGVAPSISTISQGFYKIQRPFLFLIKGEPTGEIKAFIDWVLGPEGQAIIKQEKVVPVNNTK
ncbi:MAG: phosphate ABC transporter substrate-binding protein [Methanobacteriaceae archaeon]